MMVLQTVQELTAQLDPSRVLELYSVEQGASPQHIGAFNLDAKPSYGELLSSYGSKEVVSYQEYKVYTLVYIKK